jgi:ribose transport system substrate-binding protein
MPRRKEMDMGRRTVFTLVIALAALAAVLAAGCQRGGGGGGEGGRIGLSISTLNNPFFVSLRDGAQQAAKDAGTELIISDAQNDAATQQDDVQNFVTQQVDAILVNPVDTAAIVPAIQAANQADIPVLCLDRGASGGKIDSLIASNNVEGGRIAARELIKLVGSGPVAQLEGIPGTSAARDRGEGFEEVVDGQDRVEVVASQTANFDRAEALNVMENILQANRNVKGIFAQNDEMALGAVRALGGRAGSEVKIVGFDGIEDALNAVQSGRMNATVAQQPAKIGSLGVMNAMKVMRGDSVPKNISVPVRLVTKDNVSQFL